MIEWKPLVLIVEDDEDMAKLNARLLSRHGCEALIAHTMSEALLILDKCSPDLFVLDIGLPDGSGLTLCRELHEASDAPILFLTGRSSTDDKITGLQAGGDYYMTKPYDKDEFLAVVQSLLRRTGRMREMLHLASNITKGTLTLKVDERRAYVGGIDAELTSKEFSVLLLLVQNEGKELTYKQLYESVWETQMNKDSSALRQQISRIKKKLGEDCSEDFSIFNEHGIGYTFVHARK